MHALDRTVLEFDQDALQQSLGVDAARIDADCVANLDLPAPFVDVTMQTEQRLLRLYGLQERGAAGMHLNGIAHLAASVYLDRWAPGATTAPLLIIVSVWLAVAARRSLRSG